MNRERGRMSFKGLREMEKLMQSGAVKIQRSDQAAQQRMESYIGELATLQGVRTQIVAGMMNGFAQGGQMPSITAEEVYNYAEALALEDFKRRLTEAAETLRHLKFKPDDRFRYIAAVAGVDLEAICPAAVFEEPKDGKPGLIIAPGA